MAIQPLRKNSDSTYLTQTPKDEKIDPDFAKKMDIARQGIKKYRNALINLAQ